MNLISLFIASGMVLFFTLFSVSRPKMPLQVCAPKEQVKPVGGKLHVSQLTIAELRRTHKQPSGGGRAQPVLLSIDGYEQVLVVKLGK